MPTWNAINEEIRGIGESNGCDVVRQKYLKALQDRSGRTLVAYYSGFLHTRMPDGRSHRECSITDLDMNGFMAVVHGLDHNRGLDLIIHTPGGGVEATRSIIEYLYKMFGRDIRVIVPHMAMSAGTMMACASKEVLMGKHSCLGPTDPHVQGIPTMGVLAEVERAVEEIKKEPIKQFIYQQIFAKYPPAFLVDCERSIKNSETMVREWLKDGMFSGEAGAEESAKKAISGLMDYEGTSEHAHHFLADKCREMGLKVVDIEDDQDLQEDILSVHHAFMATFTQTDAIKIVENANGGDWSINAKF